jgi:hypothetical protein
MSSSRTDKTAGIIATAPISENKTAITVVRPKLLIMLNVESMRAENPKKLQIRYHDRRSIFLNSPD